MYVTKHLNFLTSHSHWSWINILCPSFTLVLRAGCYIEALPLKNESYPLPGQSTFSNDQQNILHTNDSTNASKLRIKIKWNWTTIHKGSAKMNNKLRTSPEIDCKRTQQFNYQSLKIQKKFEHNYSNEHLYMAHYVINALATNKKKNRHTSDWTKGCDWTEPRIMWNLLLIFWCCTVSHRLQSNPSSICETLRTNHAHIYKDIPTYHLQHNEDYRVHANRCTFTDQIPVVYVRT